MLRCHPKTKRYSAEIKHRTFGRIHLSCDTKVKAVAMNRHAALQHLLDTGEPVRDIVDALRNRKLTIHAVEECVRQKRPFDTLRASTWPTLGDAIKQYHEAQAANDDITENTARGGETALKHALDKFGATRPIESITYDEVTEYKQYLQGKQLERNTVTLYMIKFGALFSFLQKRETKRAVQLKRPPAVLLSPMDRSDHVPGFQKTRVRYLNEIEAERMLAASPEDFELAVALGIFAGLRIGEIEALRWHTDLAAEQGMIYVQERDGWKPKYGKNREIPISSALEPFVARAMLRAGAKASYVFPGRAEGTPTGRTKLRYAISRVVTDAGLEAGRETPDGITFHTLRHTFASWLVMAGADLFTVAGLMGHANTNQVEQTYAHLSPKHRLATVELVSARWLIHKAADTASTHPKTPQLQGT